VRRVHVTLRLNVDVAGTPDDDTARQVATRHIKRWLDQPWPKPMTGVSLDVVSARMGRVSRAPAVGRDTPQRDPSRPPLPGRYATDDAPTEKNPGGR